MTLPLAKRFKRSVRYLLLKVVLAVASRLPLAVAQRVGDAFGGLAFRLAPSERRKALLSLGVAFPEKSDAERWALAHACFRHLGRVAFEAAVASRLSPAQFDALVEVPEDARSTLRRLYAAGKGVVLVSGHVGHWEFLGMSVVRNGLPLHVIARETVDVRLNGIVEAFRAQGGVRTILRGAPGAAMAMLRTLRRGGVLGLLIDQDTRVQSLFVPFFGKNAATARAPADFALRTGAATAAVFLQRTASGRYRFHAQELAVAHTGDAEADALALTAQYSLAIEEAIRRAPEQWVWMHQRWKTVC